MLFRSRVRSTGDLEYEFDAKGFGPPPECDPNRKPTFRLDRNLQPVGDQVPASGSAKVSVKATARAE